RRDLAISVLAWQPDFEVVGFRRAETHVSRRQHDAAIRQFEILEDLFGVASHRLQLIIRGFGKRDLDQLHFVELMEAYQAARIFAVAARFRSEARCIRGHLYRQARGVENLVTVDISQRHLRSMNQIQTAFVGNLEQVLFELRELSGAEQSPGVDHEWRLHIFIAVHSCLPLETEIYQRALEPRAPPFEYCEPGPADFRCALQVEQSQSNTDVHVIPRFEREVPGRSPARDLDVRSLIDSYWNGIVRQIGDAVHETLEVGFDRRQCGFRSAYSFPQFSNCDPARLGLIPTAGLHQYADLLTLAVTTGVQIVPLANESTSSLVQLGERIEQSYLKLPLCELLADQIKVAAHKVNVEHDCCLSSLNDNQIAYGEPERCVNTSSVEALASGVPD